jgi:hypothetical protein
MLNAVIPTCDYGDEDKSKGGVKITTRNKGKKGMNFMSFLDAAKTFQEK